MKEEVKLANEPKLLEEKVAADKLEGESFVCTEGVGGIEASQWAEADR